MVSACRRALPWRKGICKSRCIVSPAQGNAKTDRLTLARSAHQVVRGSGCCPRCGNRLIFRLPAEIFGGPPTLWRMSPPLPFISKPLSHAALQHAPIFGLKWPMICLSSNHDRDTKGDWNVQPGAQLAITYARTPGGCDVYGVAHPGGGVLQVPQFLIGVPGLPYDLGSPQRPGRLRHAVAGKSEPIGGVLRADVNPIETGRSSGSL